MPRRIFRSRAYQLAQEPESLVMMARSGSRGDNSQVTRCGLTGLAGRHGALFQRLPPFVVQVLRCLGASSPSAFLLEQRQQRAQGLRGVADEIDLHRIAQAQHVGLDVDLHAARLPFLRQEFGIGKARADHQQRVAFHHQFVARLGAEQADRAGDPGQVVGQRRFAEQRLGDAGSEPIGDRDHLVGGRSAPAPTSMATFLPRVQHVGRAAQIGS